ncbi:hypothetical protein HMI56_007441 [Coelomomyces lativittatus]|nr:hypothetical protein HMI56_007441 [Coelomomyces lativittatus]
MFFIFQNEKKKKKKKKIAFYSYYPFLSYKKKNPFFLYFFFLLSKTHLFFLSNSLQKDLHKRIYLPLLNFFLIRIKKKESRICKYPIICRRFYTDRASHISILINLKEEEEKKR